MPKAEPAEAAVVDNSLHEYSSIQVSVNGIPVEFEGIKSISYESKDCPPGVVTSKIFETTGSLTILSGWNRMLYSFGFRPHSGYWARRYDWDRKRGRKMEPKRSKRR